MHPVSVLIERTMKLPPARTRDLVHERDLRVPMPDGVELLADRWAPRDMTEPLPTVLARSPYGRRGPIATMVWPLAERGFQVVMQSTRGTFGSGGEFDPLRREREDGLATLEWIVKQPWFGDALVLTGGSYLGVVQWAVAAEAPPQVKAMIPIVTESALTLDFLRADSYSLEVPFQWGVQVADQDKGGILRGMIAQLMGARKVGRALRTLPLKDADLAAIGRHYDYIQNILVHDAEDPFWAKADHRGRVTDVTVPVSSIGGWYDIFLPGQLRDFRALQEAGRPARLTVGPWTHGGGAVGVGITETVEFGLAHARGEPPPEREPVRLFVMGHGKWRGFPAWPPPGYRPRRFHLRPDGGLGTEAPPDSEPDTYRYDPADPTPTAGGVRLMRNSGRVLNNRLEARPDVLTFTTPPLDEDVEVIGDVSAEIWFRSSLPYADVFVRLCDVDERGRSYNVCDGLLSVTGADTLGPVRVELWPTAHRFLSGHRIRVQVSSGAFPRYARNPGTGEPLATAATLRAADQQVFHDREHPSAILLPCLTA